MLLSVKCGLLEAIGNFDKTWLVCSCVPIFHVSASGSEKKPFAKTYILA
jgi:hypothetical protein